MKEWTICIGLHIEFDTECFRSQGIGRTVYFAFTYRPEVGVSLASIKRLDYIQKRDTVRNFCHHEKKPHTYANTMKGYRKEFSPGSIHYRETIGNARLFSRGSLFWDYLMKIHMNTGVEFYNQNIFYPLHGPQSLTT